MLDTGNWPTFETIERTLLSRHGEAERPELIAGIPMVFLHGGRPSGGARADPNGSLSLTVAGAAVCSGTGQVLEALVAAALRDPARPAGVTFDQVLEDLELDLLPPARGRTAASFEELGAALAQAGTAPPDLVRDLNWAASIAEVLGGGLRGNPRQLKRFLNNLLLKHRSAQRRKISLDLPVLAKLMVLEEQHFSDFQRLFDWQLTSPGPTPELAGAESVARVSSVQPNRRPM